MGSFYSKFNDSDDSNDFDFCCCPNKGVDLDQDYRQNDTDYCDEYIGVI